MRGIIVDVRKVAALREQGRSWPEIAKQLGIGRRRHGISCSPGAFQKPQGGKPFENPRFRCRGCGLNQRGLLASKSRRQAFDKELILEAFLGNVGEDQVVIVRIFA